MLDFGRWIVEVAVNGVKSGSFDRDEGRAGRNR